MLERIQKIISAAGIASRRAAEQLILDGRVRVNGKVVTELGTKADAAKDHIKVDGKLINPRQPLTYIMLNKPAGYVTTMSDPEGRPTVQDLLKGIRIRVYPVGRLDYNTEGLLLLTNDGDFAHLITHPKHEFPKTYRAKVKGVLEDRQIDELEKGIYLDDGKTAPAKVKKLSKEEANSWLEITIHEGRKRQVRRMFDRVGHSVIKLKRVRTGNLVLGDLPEGSFRYLTPDEVQAMKELATKEWSGAAGAREDQVKRREVPEPRGKGPAMAAGLRSLEARVPRTGPSMDRAHKGEGKPFRPSFTPSVKGGAVASPLHGRGKFVAGEGRTGGAVRGAEGRRQTQKPRVPGQGASGRGPRQPLRDTGNRRSQGAGFTGSKAGSPVFKEKSRMRTATGHPGHGESDRGVSTSSAFRPQGKKTTVARMRGKIFDTGPSRKPGTERPARPRAGDRKPPRTFERHEIRKSTLQGTSRKPYHTKK
ncbi:MAG TPA: pseudouridine synthase [Nitrospirota bacterium]|nr:pseudouridine synthase [Nitrospirota bacterium]